MTLNSYLRQNIAIRNMLHLITPCCMDVMMLDCAKNFETQRNIGPKPTWWVLSSYIRCDIQSWQNIYDHTFNFSDHIINIITSIISLGIPYYYNHLIGVGFFPFLSRRVFHKHLLPKLMKKLGTPFTQIYHPTYDKFK